MTDHHQLAIQRLRAAYEADPEVLAVIVGGSVAKGWAKDSSDLDFMLVTDEASFQRANQEGHLMVYRTDLTDYEGGYADGKIVPLSFLNLVAERGSEPARAAFLRAIVLFDRTDQVTPLLTQILAYPEADRDEKLRRFHSQLMIWSWYVGEAAKREDPYLLARSSAELALFAMRLVLAQNRRFYPYHKWVTRMVEECPDQPEAFISTMNQMLSAPSPETAKALVDLLHAWLPLEVDFREHCHHFLEDSEWNWVHHPAPIGDR